MMSLNLLLTIAAVLGVIGYYVFLWVREGSHNSGSVVIQYSPPRELSPAMLRYVWKERFDDRTFWACILSLLSNGLVTMECREGNTFVRKNGNAAKPVSIAVEEKVLLNALFHRKKRESLSIDDATAAYAIWQVAQELRKAAVGKWFYDNRKSVLVGTLLSLVASCVAVNPQSIEQLGALGLALCFMAPSGYYLFFVLLRLADLFRVFRGRFQWAAFSQVGVLLFLMCSCIVSLAIGSVVLAGNSSVVALAATGLLVAVNVGSLLWLRMPIKSGQELLDSIEGFREFLRSVERLPMDRPDAPSIRAGLYEKYLPYAVALEVEQSWSDSFVAANSSYHEQEFQGLHPLYLGMWDGKPVEVAFRVDPHSLRD